MWINVTKDFWLNFCQDSIWCEETCVKPPFSRRACAMCLLCVFVPLKPSMWRKGTKRWRQPTHSTPVHLGWHMAGGLWCTAATECRFCTLSHSLSAVFQLESWTERKSSFSQPHLAPPSANPLSTCFIHYVHSTPYALFSQMHCSEGLSCLASLTNGQKSCVFSS